MSDTLDGCLEGAVGLFAGALQHGLVSPTLHLRNLCSGLNILPVEMASKETGYTSAAMPICACIPTHNVYSSSWTGVDLPRTSSLWVRSDLLWKVHLRHLGSCGHQQVKRAVALMVIPGRLCSAFLSSPVLRVTLQLQPSVWIYQRLWQGQKSSARCSMTCSWKRLLSFWPSSGKRW